MQNQIVLCIQFTCVLTLWLSGSATLRVVAHQAPLSMRFSRQEYWSGLPCPSPGDLPYPGIEPESLMSLALAGRVFTTSERHLGSPVQLFKLFSGLK